MYVPGVDSLIKFTDRVKKRWTGNSPYSTYSPYINVGTSNSLTAIAYGKGEKKTHKIPNGQTFSGRTEGGMTRDKIYGTSVYGSGYIAKSDQALGTVTGKNFPSYFWPIDWSESSTSSSNSNGNSGSSWDDGSDGSNWDGTTWDDGSNGNNNGNNGNSWNNGNSNGNSWNNGNNNNGNNNNGWNNYAVDNSTNTAVNTSSNWYSGSSSEFGGPTNPARPGGALAYATFTASDWSSTAMVLADNATLYSIINTTTYECGNYLSDPSSVYATAFDGWDNNEPQQNQAVQYYRASSVVLTVDNSNGNSGSYNNGGYSSGYNSGYSSYGGYSTYSGYGSSSNGNSNGYSSGSYGSMVDCLNRTIGASVPLVGSAYSWAQPGQMMGSLSLFWVLGAMLYALF